MLYFAGFASCTQSLTALKCMLVLAEGFTECLPVQWNVWHELSGGQDFAHDLCIASPTGSGKTLAYCLPLAQALSRYTS